MKYLIISGSNRKDSGSRKVANYINATLEDSEIFDLYEKNIPLWTDAMWNADSDQSQEWQDHVGKFDEAEGFVFIVPEWDGMAAVSAQNLMHYLKPPQMAHKPILLVGVSASRGGAYPIAEMRSFSFKNNGLLYIPDHVIVRDIGDVLDDVEINDEHKADTWIKQRLLRSIDILRHYTKHTKALRDEMNLDLDDYPYGM